MKINKYTSLEDLENKYFGKEGTKERDEYELELSMEILGERIKEIRKKQNLTQEQLGKLVGVQKAQISKIENGKSSATITTITKIFNALKAKVKLYIEYDYPADILSEK